MILAASLLAVGLIRLLTARQLVLTVEPTQRIILCLTLIAAVGANWAYVIHQHSLS